MSVIKVNNVSKSYGNNEVLKQVGLDINAGEKIGIVGVNGSGKSTLIKIIMGVEQPDSGKVEVSNYNIGYLRQATEYSLKDFIDMSTDKTNISDFLKLAGELNINSEIDFDDKRLQNLSGGEKTKMALSSILASHPSILLLDEPTNHVDIESIEWLIDRINNYQGTVLVVSHDRYFLNQTVQKIVEIEDGKLKIYYGNYDDYQRQKTEELEALKAKYETQQKQDKKIQREINQLKQWSEKGEREAGKQGGSRSDAKVKGVKTNAQRKAAKVGRNAESKKTRLEQMRKDYIEKPKEEQEIKFDFNGHNSGANSLIRITDLSKSFGKHLIFKDVNLIISNDEKIGLIGPNGSGKSTFIKILMGQEKQDKGEVWTTPSLKVAYMSQDVFDLSENKTIFEMANEYDNETKQFFFSNLVNMGFDRELFRNKINTLSLGQRMRIKLAQIIVNDYNLLILDEPTNHLDLANKIELENALVNFPGAVIIASHDKYLLSKVANKVFVFKNEEIKRYEDSYSEYMEKETISKSQERKSPETTSIQDRLRMIEDEMADPSKSPEDIEKLLEVYYELLEIESNMGETKKNIKTR